MCMIHKNTNSEKNIASWRSILPGTQNSCKEMDLISYFEMSASSSDSQMPTRVQIKARLRLTCEEKIGFAWFGVIDRTLAVIELAVGLVALKLGGCAGVRYPELLAVLDDRIPAPERVTLCDLGVSGRSVRTMAVAGVLRGLVEYAALAIAYSAALLIPPLGASTRIGGLLDLTCGGAVGSTLPSTHG